jgi:hypothetical protein
MTNRIFHCEKKKIISSGIFSSLMEQTFYFCTIKLIKVTTDATGFSKTNIHSMTITESNDKLKENDYTTIDILREAFYRRKKKLCMRRVCRLISISFDNFVEIFYFFIAFESQRNELRMVFIRKNIEFKKFTKSCSEKKAISFFFLNKM